MSQVQKFSFGLMDLRVIEQDGQPWFVLKDVCDALGLRPTPSNGSYQGHYKRLAKDELSLAVVRLAPSNQTIRYKLVNESGLYKFVIRSDKPQAKAFQDWVTRVVLPAIRKDGAYVLGEEKVVTGEISEDELILRAMQAQQKKVERLVFERDRLAAQNLHLEKELTHLEQHTQQLLPAATVGQAVAKRKALGVVDFCRKLEVERMYCYELSRAVRANDWDSGDLRYGLAEADSVRGGSVRPTG
ncbi:BRO family protein [Pseudomonas berkeleyensis]|uniref:Bro-N domain-containing protein n=1 Tax=Pseudomonas berkeleyensis TaxID=2726956 RepID=A0A7G5DMS6_9PSED|nr:BRO family protein [Pseudomonas berkeleyensis]QMV63051.1 hypothetical protein HS968_24030 [Pseudomonas berkeleyensis]WSO38506.1 BRO family protein [Pseudomonas berkeleyensis]